MKNEGTGLLVFTVVMLACIGLGVLAWWEVST